MIQFQEASADPMGAVKLDWFSVVIFTDIVRFLYPCWYQLFNGDWPFSEKVDS